MFGSKKTQELENMVQELQGKLNQVTAEKTDLAQKLDSANSRIADLESRLQDFDLERLKEEATASRAEFEGLRDLYNRKNKEFDEYKVEEEERFARDQAMQRHNLENEIRDNRQANQEYVTSTIKTFGESYNYYLNRIKEMMDALSTVAACTGEALFSGENTDLKSRFGSQMRDLLKAGSEPMEGEAEELIFEEAQQSAEETVEEPKVDML